MRKEISSKKILTAKEPERNLLLSLKQRAGRANTGRITVRHRGGGNKKLYRIIDFSQEKINIPAKVIAIEYDPYRSGFIALLEYEGGNKRYILAPQGLKIGDQVLIAEQTTFQPGNRMKLKNIPVGTPVYNIELEPGKGGILARSAGVTAKVLACEGKLVSLEMPSTEIRQVSKECFASVGAVSHPENRFINVKKAGKMRHRGVRPTVRGTAMNPVDHPHGGGEGKTGIGLKHPKTPWGKPARGVKTRDRNRWTSRFIVQRRKKEKRVK